MSLWERQHPLPIVSLSAPKHRLVCVNDIWKMRHCSCAGEALLSGQRVSSLLPCDGPLGTSVRAQLVDIYKHAHTIKFTFSLNSSRFSLSFYFYVDVCVVFLEKTVTPLRYI